jgi:hypothetical protein
MPLNTTLHHRSHLIFIREMVKIIRDKFWRPVETPPSLPQKTSMKSQRKLTRTAIPQPKQTPDTRRQQPSQPTRVRLSPPRATMCPFLVLR